MLLLATHFRDISIKKRLYIGNVIAIIGLVINLIGLASADIYILI